MNKPLKKYKDESNRADFINYSAPGKYFLTISTENREHLFGEIKKGVMNLSKYGKIVADEIVKIPEYHKRAILDEWVVMPDHIHMIIELGGWDFDNAISSVGEPTGQIHEFAQRLSNPTDDEIKKYRSLRRKMIIFKIIGKLQMLTSKQINIIRNTPGRRNWQRDYHDQRIRSYDDYLRIKNYIIENPVNWK
jgi:putative transposase